MGMEPSSSWVAMLGSLVLRTRRDEEAAPPVPEPDSKCWCSRWPAEGTAALSSERGSGDNSRSDSGDEAYERRDVIGKRKSSESASSGCKREGAGRRERGCRSSISNTQTGHKNSAADTNTPKGIERQREAGRGVRAQAQTCTGSYKN